MKARAVLAALATMGAMLAVPAPPVRAGSLEGGDTCVTANPGGGALALKATIAAEVDVEPAPPSTVRVALRLERSGVLYFDRILLAVPIVPNTHADFICLFLPHEDNKGVEEAIANLGARILGAFGIPSERNLCLTQRSVTKAEALSPLPFIPGTSTVATMVDATLYAVNGPCTP